MVLMVLTGCGHWRPFNDAVVGSTTNGVMVVEFGGAGTAATGHALTTLLPFLGWTVAQPESYLLACSPALCLAGCGVVGTGLLGHRMSAALIARSPLPT